MLYYLCFAYAVFHDTRHHIIRDRLSNLVGESQAKKEKDSLATHPSFLFFFSWDINDVCGEILIVDLPLLTGVRRTRRLLPHRLRRLFMLSVSLFLSFSTKINQGREKKRVKFILTGRAAGPSRVRPPALLPGWGSPASGTSCGLDFDGKPVQRSAQGCCFTTEYARYYSREGGRDPLSHRRRKGSWADKALTGRRTTWLYPVPACLSPHR